MINNMFPGLILAIILSAVVALILWIIFKFFVKKQINFLAIFKATSISFVLSYVISKIWIIVLVKAGQAGVIYTAPLFGFALALILLIIFVSREFKRAVK